MKKLFFSFLLLATSLSSWGVVCKGDRFTVEILPSESGPSNLAALITETKTGSVYQELKLLGYDMVLNIPDSKAMGFYNFRILEQRNDLPTITSLTWEFSESGKKRRKLVSKVTFTINNSLDLSVNCL